MGKARLVEEGAVYHVYCRGNNKVKIFLVGHDYAKYISNLREYKKQLQFELYAYMLMPNHLHLLLKPRVAADLSTIMRSLNVSYSSWHNRRYGCVGHVWQGRFQSKIIRKDEDFLRCMLYIEANPIKANLVEDPRDYRWSSCNQRFIDKDNSILDLHPIYIGLGKTKQERIRSYHQLLII